MKAKYGAFYKSQNLIDHLEECFSRGYGGGGGGGCRGGGRGGGRVGGYGDGPDSVKSQEFWQRRGVYLQAENYCKGLMVFI